MAHAAGAALPKTKEIIMQKIVCLDLEGVLVPEIWIAFSQASGIPELKRTTRDEPDYDKLMKWRLGILKEHGLGLKEIQETIAGIDPLPGAIFRRAALHLPGDHHQRYLYSVCFPSYEEAGMAHFVLQFAGSGSRWRDHRLSHAHPTVQAFYCKSAPVHWL